MKTLLALALVLVISGASRAQNKEQTFASFWTWFKAAIAKNDKEAVASMTKLPFLFESEERDKRGFIAIYDKLFDRKLRRCIQTAKPLKEGESYEIFCGELILYFSRVDGKFKLIEFGVND